jgi:hypothetical protein
MNMRRSISVVFLMLSMGSIAMAIEEPYYTVVLRADQFEIRRYDPYIVVETMIAGSEMDDASNAGFRKLFKYISGNNRANAEIAMTAPVITERSEKIAMTAPVTTVRTPEGFAIAFVVPKGYTMQTTPVPNDSTVYIREVPGRTVAVIRFSGRWTDANMKEHEQELMQWIKDTGKIPASIPVIARYDPPFMPWFLRRNEIQIEIAP